MALVIAALASFASGALLMAIGVRLLRRHHEAPLRSFAVWWLGLGAATAAVGGRVLAGQQGSALGVTAFLAIGIALTGLGIWGLLDYLSHVYRGRPAPTVAWAYGALVAATLAYMAASWPRDIIVRSWTVDLEGGAVGGLMDLLLMLAFLLPPVVAGVLLLRLLPRTGPEQRRRVLAVGIGIPAWVLVHILARIGEADAWQFFTRVVLGIGVAAVILVAFGEGPRSGTVAGTLEERVRALI